MKHLLHDIQQFMINEVKNDISFNELVYEKLGKQMTYCIDPHILDEDEDIPSFAIYGIESTKDINGSDYSIQFIITDIVENRAEIIDGIKVYPTKKNLEILANESVKLIEKVLRSGINGMCNLSIAHRSLFMTPIGEADDVKAIVTFRLNERKTI